MVKALKAGKIFFIADLAGGLMLHAAMFMGFNPIAFIQSF